MKSYDVVIIGGGPAGLSCALYCARAKLSTVVLDKAPSAGALASTAKIANYPGVLGPVPGPELLDVFREQAISFGAEYSRNPVAAVDVVSEPKVVYTTNDIYHSRTLVIATGSLGRADRIEGEETLIGRGVSYCVTCDAAFYADKVAGIVGNDEVALEEALFLARFAREVHFIVPTSHLSAHSDMLDEITATSNITMHMGLRAKSIIGEQKVTGVICRDRDNIESMIPLDGIFMLLSGNAPITDFLGGAVELRDSNCIHVDLNFASSVPGVYAAGDVTCLHPKQAIIAAAEGVIAALSIDKFLSGKERARVDYM